ncbi:MAG: ShlB/FhaC/HecB family hemolysin secretion/activation protein [Nitrosomonadales bacterium]|nr:ShlB/FhaC/HecB family hemolysin secretion/activation protein [Nitrosomonadales bacterium]
MALANQVLAQQRPDAGRVLDTVKEPRAVPKPAPEIAIQPEAKPALKAQPGLKVKVAAFKISGNTIFSEAALLPLVSGQIGKELDFEELNQTANKIAVHYRSKGYFLAQAYLPAQQIKDGIVEIAVLEGRVGEVKLNMAEKVRLRESRARGILGAIQPGDPINERSLERGLLLLNDTPGVIVKSTLQPGAKVGTADVAVELGDDGRRVSGSVKLDNWGSRYTGEYRVGADLNVSNPSGFGDLISVTGLTSNGNGSPMGRLSYVVPLGPWGTKLGASYSKLDYTLGKDFASSKTHGTAEVGSIYMLHPFVRTRNFNVVGVLGANQKKLKDLVDTDPTYPRNERNLRVFNAGISGDFSDNVFGGSLNTFSLTATSGNVDIKIANQKALDQNPAQGGYNTSGSYSKLNYEYQRQQALPRNLSLLVSLQGQTASKNLVSAEQFSLGGPNAVRAYPVGEAVGDEGVVVNAEIRWNVPQTPFMLNGFIDFGHAQLHKTPTAADITQGNPAYRNVLGYGLGLNVGKQNNYLLRTSVAWRSDRKDSAPVADRDRSPRAWVQLTKWF